jgi:hypothetical protein
MALAGCLMVLFVARAMPAWRLMAWMGQNTLILMCLNGIFYHYTNPPMAEWVVDHLPGTPLTVWCVGLYDDSRQHGRLHTADLPVETVGSPTGGPADGSGATAEKPDLTPNEEDPSCTPTFFQRSPSRA